VGLTPGARLGAYEILSLLGSGGMGEVYRARDVKLGRDVAIKVLPQALRDDPERLARFEREARTLAALSHQNIAHVHGFEDSAGVPALVMELVDGPTLADGIALGPIPLDEALPIATQIAMGLEAAHEQGIVHRDLKPANIKVRGDGTVKILDFGLAKVLEHNQPASINATQSPTITTPAMMSGLGLIVGTPAYMSPEQAKGRPADRRCDLWAFGCVVYEMLTGARAFEGDDVSDTLANVLKSEPDWNALSARVPLLVQRLVRRCLEKDRTRRLDSAAVARLDLEEAQRQPASLSTHSIWHSRERLGWGATMVIVTGIALAAWIRQSPGNASPDRETRLDMATPPTDDPLSFAVSPDGRRLVFVATSAGTSRLWLRSLDATTAEPLPGTEGARYPFWAPDSQSVAFFTTQGLERLDLGASRPHVLTSIGTGRGGTWGADGVILFAPATGPLSRVSASGGDVVVVTKVDPPNVRSHRFPSFLNDSRKFIFYAIGRDDASGIYLGSLDSPDVKRLTAADTAAAYMPSGSLLYVRQGALVAHRIDLTRGTLVGDAVTIADPVGADENQKVGAFSVSAAGVIVYRAIASVHSQLAWFDRSGRQVGTVGGTDDGVSGPTISPDGRQIAVTRSVQGNQNIWLLDGIRSIRFTFDLSVDNGAVWSPDGTRIAFTSMRKGVQDIYVKSSSNLASETPLLEGPIPKPVDDWSPNGRFILFHQVEPQLARDLWVMPVDGDRAGKPFLFLRTRFDETGGRFSPDGRWVAYESNITGQWQVYLRAFSGVPDASASSTTSSGGQPVSSGGGIQARWRRDGKELYYIAPGGALMAVPITTTASSISPGVPVALFQTRIVGNGAFLSGLNGNYDVAPDGRFLINVTSGDAATQPITVLQHWIGKGSR